MKDGSKKNGGEQAGSAPEKARSGSSLQEEHPDILEVFGADPLVTGAQKKTDKPHPHGDQPKAGNPVTESVESRAELQATAEVAKALNPEETLDGEGWPADPDLVDPMLSESNHALWDPMGSPMDDLPTGETDQAHDHEHTPTSQHDDETRGQSPLAAERSLAEMRGLLQLNEDRLGRLEITLEGVAKQSSFIPPKLRGLGKKVDELSTSMGDARLRSVLGDVVGLGDLVEGALRAFPEENGEIPRVEGLRYFQAMLTRVGQILDTYDLSQIPTDIDFDPNIHNAIDVEPVSDEELDGKIIETVRPGYRSEHSVLRYAEVTVGRYDPTLLETAAQEDAPASNEEDAAPDASEPSQDKQAGSEPHDVSPGFAPFLGASGTAEDSKNLTKRGTRKSSKKKKSTDD